MFIRIVGEKENVFFECDKVIETDTFLQFMDGDKIYVQIIYADKEKLRIYAMNDSGRTVNNWNIYPEGKKKNK